MRQQSPKPSNKRTIDDGSKTTKQITLATAVGFIAIILWALGTVYFVD